MTKINSARFKDGMKQPAFVMIQLHSLNHKIGYFRLTEFMRWVSNPDGGDVAHLFQYIPKNYNLGKAVQTGLS